jgi:hypothetical protein
MALAKGAPRESAQALTLREQPRAWFLHLSRILATTLVRDPRLQRFAQASWDEVIDVVAAQMAENRWIAKHKGLDAPDLGSLVESLPFAARREQVSACTVWTIQRRVQIARGLIEIDEPILLLGDNDLLSIGLARAGFRNITVVAQDMALLSVIARCARLERYAITLRFSPPEQLLNAGPNRDYALVFADPQYEINDLKQCLRAVPVSTIGHGVSKTMVFLSVNSMSLLRSGLAELDEMLSSEGFAVETFYPGFNAYPILPLQRALLSLADHAMLLAPAPLHSGLDFSFFTSDGILLKKGTVQPRCPTICLRA